MTFFFNRNIFKMVSDISKETLSQVDADPDMAIPSKVLATLPKIPITVSELRSLYFGDEKISEETLINYADFLGDLYFLRGIMQVADIQMNNNDSGKTYLYQFSYESETALMRKILKLDLPGTAVNEFKSLIQIMILMLKCIYTHIVIKII